MKEKYELIGGPIDGGIVEIESSPHTRTVIIEPPDGGIRVFYTTDPTDPNKLLYIGSRPKTDTGIKSKN